MEWRNEARLSSSTERKCSCISPVPSTPTTKDQLCRMFSSVVNDIRRCYTCILLRHRSSKEQRRTDKFYVSPRGLLDVYITHPRVLPTEHPSFLDDPAIHNGFFTQYDTHYLDSLPQHYTAFQSRYMGG